MIKHLFLLLLFIHFFSPAQTWCPPGAVWHHTLIPRDAVNPKTGVVEDKYVGDTLVNGKMCKKISEKFTGKASPLSPVTTNNNVNRTTYSYLENGVLYVYAGGTFDTIVNFNAAIGDKWLHNRLPGTCNGRRAVTVIDTNHIVINNFNLKRIVTTYSNTYIINNTTYTNTVTDEIIERIMTINKYIFPMHCELNNFSEPNTLDHYGELICYEDDNFPLYKRSGFEYCDYPTSLHEFSKLEYGITIFPIPAKDQLTIEIEKPGNYKLSLTDLFGKEIRKEETMEGKHTFTINELEKGVYFLTIMPSNG